jgi:hypothetical protein
MTEAQRIIKYIAIAFAIFLIVTIISGISFGIYGLFTLGDNLISNQNIEEKCQSAEEHCLQISLAAANLNIKTGEAVKVDTKNDKIETTIEGGKIIIAEKGRHLFDSYNDRDVTLYLPEDISYDKIYISGGAGNINIESLSTSNLEMSLGVGSSEIKNLDAKNAKISTGIGDTKIDDFETEDAKISAGIGEVSVSLKSKAEDYRIEVSKGIGSITLNDTSLSDGIIGSGSKKLDISGGIGSVKITTK